MRTVVHLSDLHRAYDPASGAFATRACQRFRRAAEGWEPFAGTS